MTLYLSSSEAAEHLGLSANTFRSYMRKGLAPEPDAVVGLARPVYGWLVQTLDYWQAHRLGRGRRTDLDSGL